MHEDINVELRVIVQSINMSEAHGHEKYEAHAEHGGGGKFEKGILNALKGAALGLAMIAIAPTVISALPLLIPSYMYAGMASGIVPGVVGGMLGARLAGANAGESAGKKKDSHAHGGH